MKDKALKEHKNIEELFKNSFEGFEADPGANAWSNIQSQIGSPATGSVSAGNSSIWAASGSKILTAVVALGIVGLSIGGYYFFDSKGVKNKQARENKNIEIQPESNIIQKDASEQNKATSKETQVIEATVNSVITSDIKDKKIESKSDEITSSSTIKNKERSAISDDKISEGTKVTQEPNADITDNKIDPPAIVTEEKISEEVEKIINEIENDYNSVQNNNPSLRTDNIIVEQANNEVSKPTIERTIEEPDYSSLVNAFTPNGDGVNDMFDIKLEGVEEMEVIILDKTGKQIHTWIGQFGFWDGRNPDNSLAPEGPYFYIISSKKEGKTFTKKGGLTLTR